LLWWHAVLFAPGSVLEGDVVVGRCACLDEVGLVAATSDCGM
jgi:hypothetical protein